MRTADFDYLLPPELIAQEPVPERGTSRMMVLDRCREELLHRHVYDLPAFLRAGDLLVVNNTRVFPARLRGHWEDSGGAVEVLLLEEADGQAKWRAMMGSGRRLRPGLRACFAGGAIAASLVEKLENGEVLLAFEVSGSLLALLEQYGATPLPPYIKRDSGNETERARLDRERYQTVYAREVGAVAAPTAGLHLTTAMLAQLAAMGVNVAHVTLHVGPGTFKPVVAEEVEAHTMDPERYQVSAATATAVNECRRRGGRVVAVGSTTVRTLESVAAHDGRIAAAEGRSALFIHPPYRFRVVDAMLTNFHLPRSTLLMMVAALAGLERVMAAYRAAVAERYAFFSYGDCMLIV